MSNSRSFACPVIEWASAPDEVRTNILARSQSLNTIVETDVKCWIDKVAKYGDEAVLDYIRSFDAVSLRADQLRITADEVRAAYQLLTPELVSAIKHQISISRRFHEKLRDCICTEWSEELTPGVITGFRRTPIESVGLYVPAGKAPLPTVAQILTIAATAARVPRIVVTFPPSKKPLPDPSNTEAAIIVAAVEAGAGELYRVGGIAAIAALALGTETIAPVQKIAGPGNPYVQVAKLLLARQVGIDMFSGPSEAVIMADDTSNPVFLAADMLARCEHGPDSAAVVVTTSRSLAETVQAEIERQAPLLSRQEYLQTALARYSAIVIVDSLDQMIDFVNAYSPEHLEIQTMAPRDVFARITNAGSTFLGDYAPVAVGDYASGTNHCLPTGRAVKFSSPISPETFLKTLQFQQLTRAGLESLNPIVREVARAEGLDAHARSVNIRFESASIGRSVTGVN